MMSARQNVGAAFDHLPRPAAVLVAIALAVSGKIVDQNGGTAFHGDPGIRPAAGRVNARIAYPQRGPLIHHDIRRTGFRRADANVRAICPSMDVCRRERPVADSRLRLHKRSRIVSQYQKKRF
jgi:hypothetical protein